MTDLEPSAGQPPGRRVVIRSVSVPRPTRLGRCQARHAPDRMVRDKTEHEDLHPRLSDCFGWEWDVASFMPLNNEQAGPVRRVPHPDGSIIDVESWEAGDGPSPELEP